MTGLPGHIIAPFQALARPEERVDVCGGDCQALLAFTDRTQLTLHLRGARGLPEEFFRQAELRLSRNAQRREMLRRELAAISGTLDRAGVEFLVLKGLTHEVGFGICPEDRVQYDIDLFSPSTGEASAALREAGYAPHGAASLSDEHARPLVRPHSWEWRGDYFDPEMPVAVEVHAALWNSRRDRVRAAGLEEFWERRCTLEEVHPAVPAFAEADRLGFAALHALRHILRNDARPAAVYELARFLQTRGADEKFWTLWRAWHPPALRALEAVAFGFARAWFGVRLPEAAEESASGLAERVGDWFTRFAWSPVANLIRPNKDVVWLHAALVEKWGDRAAVLYERLMPPRLPHREEGGPYRRRLLDRARYHAAGSLSAVASGTRWWFRTARSTNSHNSD